MLIHDLLRRFMIFLSLGLVTVVTPGLYITSPESGSNVNGIVEIRGSIPVENFSTANLYYAYTGQAATNWFLIAEIDTAVQDGLLASWDTTTITDGTYQLKLSVKEANGTINEVVVKDIRVTNYTYSGGTPDPGLSVPTGILEMQEATEILSMQPTQIPSNPAATTDDQLKSSLIIGILCAVVFLSLLLIYSAIRGSWKKSKR